MYKKRQKICDDLKLGTNDIVSLSSDEDEDGLSDVGSIARSSISEGSYIGSSSVVSTRSEAPVYRPLPRTANALKEISRPVELGYRSTIIDSRRQENGIKRVRYDRETEKLIPKRVEWQLIQDSSRMQMRQILSDSYRTTLSNIAGSETFGNLSKEAQRKGERLLLPIASNIDKELRLTLIPGKVDTKLLDPTLPITYKKLHLQIEDSYKNLAELSIKVAEREAGLAPLKEELTEMEEKYKTAKERYDTSMTIKEIPNDYVQMLLLHPSSEQY